MLTQCVFYAYMRFWPLYGNAHKIAISVHMWVKSHDLNGFLQKISREYPNNALGLLNFIAISVLLTLARSKYKVRFRVLHLNVLMLFFYSSSSDPRLISATWAAVSTQTVGGWTRSTIRSLENWYQLNYHKCSCSPISGVSDVTVHKQTLIWSVA